MNWTAAAAPGGRERACLCLLCGLPAAGKSTLARALAGELRQSGWDCLVLSYDELIPEEAFELRPGEADIPINTHSSWKLHRQKVLRYLDDFLQRSPRDALGVSGLQTNREGETWRRFVHCVQQQRQLQRLQNHSDPLRSTASQPSTTPLLILLDDNFFYQSMRYEVYQLARKHSLGFCQLYLYCEVSSCLSRNQQRQCPLPDKVIVEMAQRMEPPDLNRNPWEQNSLVLSSTDCTTQECIKNIIGLFGTALDNPLKPIQDNTEEREAARLCCASSVVHQVDQACRRLVSQAMQVARDNKVPQSDMRILAAELNQLKGSFLEDLHRQVPHGCPISPGDSVEVVVSKVAAIFDQKKTDVLRKFCTDYTSLPE
nr:PREDICTED: L-seryl-tRNA(Sec) kinase isoform X1 [Lepisosteus oculatus]